MTKAEFRKQYLEYTKQVNPEVDWQAGSDWMITSARAVESYLNDNNEDYHLPKLVASLENLQIRDYFLGLLDHNNPEHWVRVARIIKDCPVTLAKPANTLMGVLFFESGQTESALLFFVKASTYPLSQLMIRVINAGMPTHLLKEMRHNLHQTVIQNIFGEVKEEVMA